MKELWDEIDSVYQLDRPVETPVQKLYQSRHSISLKHVVAVFSQSAKDVDNLDHIIKSLTQVLEFIFVADLYPFADFYQDRNKFKFSHQMQICLLAHVQNFDYFFQSILKVIIVFNNRYDLFFQLHAQNVAALFVNRYKIFPRAGSSRFVIHRLSNHLLFDSFDFAFKSLLFFFC